MRTIAFAVIVAAALVAVPALPALAWISDCYSG